MAVIVFYEEMKPKCSSWEYIHDLGVSKSKDVENYIGWGINYLEVKIDLI
jgi:hypothetical protein